MAEGWPVVFLGQQFANLFNAKMAGQKIILVTANQLYSNSFEYKQYALIVKNVINFFIAISLLLPQFLGLAINLLQLLQLELHITNIGFIKLLISKFSLENTSETPEL